MNQLIKNGLSDNWNVINVWRNKSNGNGVYIANNGNRNYIVEVYGSGFMTDFIIVFSNGRFANDRAVISKSSADAINRAIRYAIKNNIDL